MLLNLRVFGIDGVNCTLEFSVQQIFEHKGSHPVGAVTCAKDRDGLWCEKLI